MPETKELTTADIDKLDEEDAPPFSIAFSAQERRVAEAYILLVRRQTKLSFRYLKEMLRERQEG